MSLNKRLKQLEQVVMVPKKEEEPFDLSSWTLDELKRMEHWLESDESYPLPEDLRQKIEEAQ